MTSKTVRGGTARSPVKESSAAGRELAALRGVQAVVEFAADGTVLDANDRFLSAAGYSLAEIRGKHHRIFVPAAEAGSEAYHRFWSRLGSGEGQSGEYARIGKGGREVWLHASWVPVTDGAGRVVKVVEYSTDITGRKRETASLAGQIAAVSKTQAVIEFELDGTIITANGNFLDTLGYCLDEIRGRHHSMFVEPADRATAAYRDFWAKLQSGQFDSGEYKRVGKAGREVWIQASYNPILDLNGKPFKVVKFATDTTRRKLQAADTGGQIDAISKAQAVIEFDMKGRVLRANRNFLDALGYTMAEIEGKHHSMFVEDGYRNSAAYGEFWAKLGRGEFDAGEYRRFGKNGKEAWIQASYNPIFDMNGKPFKVVKYATDITAQKMAAADAAGQLAAISKAQAVIEFNLDGTVRTANENFLTTLGFALAEIEGKHHSMFVEPSYRDTADYRDFWARLNRGQYDAGEYRRFGKGGKEVWIQASYNPILDMNGRPFKVVKYATDITARKLAAADASGQLAAISKAQAVIEFNLDGTVRSANDNFLHALGYTAAEVQGRHHSMFIPDSERSSAAYKEFWAKLNRGEYDAGEYKRLGKGGREVWIQASYNPILDMNGKPFKVVKYATDVTRQAQARNEVSRIVTTLASASEELSALSTQLESNAEETTTQVGVVAGSAEEVSQTVNVLASSTEEMNGSIREIAKNTAEAARVASEAVTLAASSNDRVAKLGESSTEIGKIIKVITSIAQQTNLLALNATIEAARAGEAGKGFAVVANEVKELAKETARATEEISQHIETIQSDTKSAVKAIADISAVIAKINDISNTIAGAVEEQSATTREMSGNVHDAASATSNISKNAQSVADISKVTSGGAGNIRAAAKDLAVMAGNLQEVSTKLTAQ